MVRMARHCELEYGREFFVAATVSNVRWRLYIQ